MNLKELRKTFRDLSGRYDLVNEDFSDNGSDFFINEAVKWLDKTLETQKTWATHIRIIPIGSWTVKFPFARAVKEVWASTVDGRRQLERRKLQDIIAGFLSKPPSEWTNGTPLFYSPAVTRYIPEDIDPTTLATFVSYIQPVPITASNYNLVILSMPVDKETLVEVVGLFYSKQLVTDDDENYWSTVHPMLLVQAAVRQTYVVGGNKPMLDTLDRYIDGELTRLGYDIVEEMIAEVDQMEG